MVLSPTRAMCLDHLILCDLIILIIFNGGKRYSSWLRHYATSRKVTGSIPDEVIGLFVSCNLSSRTMAQRSTQTLTEMSTRNLPEG
jgi:hypothetical protein